MKFMSSYDINQLEIKKPIFIVGVPRSGTTLLYHLLAQHKKLGWFSKQTLKKFLTKEYLQFIQLRRRVFSIRGFSYPEDQFGTGFFSTIAPPIEAGYLWDSAFIGDWNPTVSEKNLAILKKTIVEALTEQKKERFISKVPKNSIRISSLNKHFPNSKFIHIIRDGRAVVNSLLRRANENQSRYFGIPLKNYALGFPEKKHALQWEQVIQEIRQSSKQLNKDQYFEIRYEDLVNKTDECLKKLNKFCEIEFFNYLYKKDDKIFNFNKKDENTWKLTKLLTIKNVNKFHEYNTEIEKFVGKTLRELNYC